MTNGHSKQLESKQARLKMHDKLQRPTTVSLRGPAMVVNGPKLRVSLEPGLG